MSAYDHEVPISVHALSVVILSVGVAANAFFLTLLWRHVPKWRLGKTLLFVFHVTALGFLLVLGVPQAITLATLRGLSPAQCAPVLPMIRFPLLFQPLSLGLSAILRWRALRATLRMEAEAEPRTLRYVLALLGFTVLLVVISEVSAALSNARGKWSTTFRVCAQNGSLFEVLLPLCFMAPIPIMFYCYRRVLKALRTTMGGTAPNEDVKYMVRLFIVLTVFYYCTYLPVSVTFVVSEALGAEVPVGGLVFVSLLQISHSVFSPVLSIVLTPKYLRLAHAILARQSVTATEDKRMLSSKASATADIELNENV